MYLVTLRREKERQSEIGFLGLTDTTLWELGSVLYVKLTYHCGFVGYVSVQ